MLFIMPACNQNSKQANKSIDTKIEIDKWKKELISNKLIGSPCNFKNLQDPAAEKWRKENPNQSDGLPSNDEEISRVTADFNDDGKQDLLLYFNSNNCTGHNGGTPFFAKIIYADGSSNSNLMNEIISAILKEYDSKRTTDKDLKEVTNDYLETTTTIIYTTNINGEFRLYTKDDAHCCPSYNGKYIYDPCKKKIDIQITENKK